MSREQKIAGRLLVVDDTPAHLKMLAGALLQSGFEVETAEGGTQALAAADRNPPDLVLLDVDMPQPDGYETCRRLKAQERFANTPIIFLSGLSNVADKVAGFAAGGVDFVTKPFDIEEVKVRISTHLELASLRRAAEQHSRELAASLSKLHELEHFRHDLVHMVAHDMRSPLMAVSGYLELLDLDNARLGEDHREFVAQALDGARTLVRLIDAMLDTDRLEACKLPLQLVERDLRPILDLAVSSLGPTSARRLLIEAATPGHLIVRADGEVLRRVIANLIANALRNSEDDARVRVVTSLRGACARLEIHDTGASIPDDFRSRVFEKYATRAGDRGPHRRGIGLGLPFCRLAMEAQGGTIGFDTSAAGSTFWIELPAREAPAVAD